MKKLLLFILTCIIALSAFAKGSNMTFMDIPMDCKITKFHKKMIKKGMQYIPFYNDIMNYNTSRVYKGVFGGEDCFVQISYNPKNKFVTEAKVVIRYPSMDKCIKLYEDYKPLFQNKYKDGFFKEFEKEGKPVFSILLSEGERHYGSILMSYFDNDGYYLCLQYIILDAFQKNYYERNEDL